MDALIKTNKNKTKTRQIYDCRYCKGHPRCTDELESV